MLESDFEELLDEYVNGAITDKDFLALVSAAGSNPKWKKRFEEAEKMLEMSSESFMDRSKTMFKAKIRGMIEAVKASMRRSQAKAGLLSGTLIYLIVFVIICFFGIYPQIFLKKTNFSMMITFFQILSSFVIIVTGVYVFFFRGKD